ncbi:hypothetical protein MMC29_003852 [Sticta canariensis]|nr:hypothetical protein [Sticta canariensis]
MNLDSLVLDKETWPLKQLLLPEHREVGQDTSESNHSDPLMPLGIGLAVARYLIDHFHNVVILARGKEALEELQSEYPKQVRTVAGDMADFSLAQTAVELTIKEFGQIDGLVINHGSLPPVTTVGNCDIEAWKQNFNVNFFSAVAFAKAALPSLKRNNGRIIFTSSGAAATAYGGWGAYGSSKAALNHLAKTLSIEEPDVISIAIRPGVVDTQMQRELRNIYASGMLEKQAAKFYDLHRAGGLLKPEQPGTVIARLVLEGPEELNGEFLKWDDKSLEKFQGS